MSDFHILIRIFMHIWRYVDFLREAKVEDSEKIVVLTAISYIVAYLHILFSANIHMIS